ncbi:MAG: ABC transporter ATP-binding protein [Hyphomicrobiaceae bacterium]
MSEVVRISIDGKTWPAVAGRVRQPVLGRIEIGIERGSFVVLTGPSGCGKSTLLNIIAGLDTDFDGQIAFDPPSQEVTYIFQSPRLLPWRTVRQNIALALPDGDPRHDRIGELLSRVGLEDAAEAYPERLSLGMQRRAALARGFVLEPSVLLMDEPFVSLDDPTAQSLRQLLIDLCSSRTTTVLFVTHDRQEAVTLATRILRIGGTPATVVGDAEVRLTREERSSRDAVVAAQRRIFG